MRRRKIWISGLVLVMALLWFGVAGAAEEPVSELFSDVPILTQQARAAELTAREQQDQKDPTILRSLFVTVNFDKLAGK